MSSADNSLDFGQTIRGFTAGQKVFSRYTLTRVLGRGGMGVVWLARDDQLEREVALKFLPEVVAMDKEAIRDMKRETRRCLELTHMHIVRIYDFIQDASAAAIAMEYIDGATLAARKLEQPDGYFEVANLQGWLGQALAALEYAHTRRKVVHRDIKPANLMVDGQGFLKLADFGIAASVTDSVSRVSAQMSGAGTAVYMSPQQMMGEKPAVTDDLYAMGATLYELLTGKPPFYSGNVLLQVQSKVPPTMTGRRKELGVADAGTIPPVWEETIAACLAKNPAERPQSAGEMAERLGLVSSGSGSMPSTSAAAKPALKSDASEHKTGAASSVEAKSRAIETAPEKRARTGVYVGMAAAVIALVGGSYYFGVYKPEQARKAELVSPEQAARRAAEEKEAAKRAADEKEKAKRAADEKEAAKRAADEKEKAKRIADEKEKAKRIADEKEKARRIAAEKEAAKRAADEKEAAKRAADEKEAAKRAAEEKEKARLVAEATAARQAADEAAAKAQMEAENIAYGEILAKIIAVVDGTTVATRDITAGAVTNYTRSAPIKYRVEVEKKWKERLAGWEAAHLAAARGGIIVKTEPAGAEVTVGALETGVSPLTVKEAKLGRYPVKAKLAGYDEYSGEVEVKENEFSEVRANLERSTGSVAITSEPSGLSFELSSKEKTERGKTPVTLAKLPTGDYTLTIIRQGWPDVEQAIKVERGREAKGQAAFIGGNLEITTEPSGAAVYGEGRKLGVTPLNFTDLPPSDFEFELRLQGYKSASVRGEVKAKETARASAKLEKSAGAEVVKRWMIPGLNLAMVPIAPGTFTMGSENGDSDERPLTRVTLTKPYWLGVTEVTQSQYEAVMGANTSTVNGGNFPVGNVSWEEAMEYGRKLTERERAAGRLPAGYVYTLPSEAQWEYACRAGTIGDYAGNLEAMGWYGGNSGSRTHEVGTKQPNGWGLFDMHGNVWEWCSDWAGTYLGGSVTDPKRAVSGANRVSRGGSLNNSDSACRSANRYRVEPDYRNHSLGFRLALNPVP